MGIGLFGLQTFETIYLDQFDIPPFLPCTLDIRNENNTSMHVRVYNKTASNSVTNSQVQCQLVSKTT